MKMAALKYYLYESFNALDRYEAFNGLHRYQGSYLTPNEVTKSHEIYESVSSKMRANYQRLRTKRRMKVLSFNDD